MSFKLSGRLKKSQAFSSDIGRLVMVLSEYTLDILNVLFNNVELL